MRANTATAFHPRTNLCKCNGKGEICSPQNTFNPFWNRRPFRELTHILCLRYREGTIKILSTNSHNSPLLEVQQAARSAPIKLPSWMSSQASDRPSVEAGGGLHIVATTQEIWTIRYKCSSFSSSSSFPMMMQQPRLCSGLDKQFIIVISRCDLLNKWIIAEQLWPDNEQRPDESPATFISRTRPISVEEITGMTVSYKLIYQFLNDWNVNE